MTIKKKLQIVGIAGIVMLSLLAINFAAILREHSVREATQNSIEMSQACEQVRFQMMQNRLFLRSYMLGDTDALLQVQQGRTKLQELLTIAEGKATSDAQRSAIRNLFAAENDWAISFAAPLFERRKQVDAGNSTISDLYVFYLQQDPAAWMKRSTDLIDAAEKATQEDLQRRRSQNAFAGKLTIAVNIVAFLLFAACGIIVYKVVSSVREPMEQLITVARKIGDTGDLEHVIDTDRRDEIGDLARSFGSTVAYLKEMSTISESIAGGDLTSEVQPRSERDTLGHAFARMTEGLGTLASSVRDSATQVTASAEQVAATSESAAKISVQSASAIDEVTSTMHEMSINVQNMVKNTQMQASSVSETSASIDQMVASIQRVADTSKLLLDISNRSRQEVHNGISTMEKTTDGLNRINTSIQSSAEIIGILDQRAEDIGKIIEVIDDIAEQTNLLALNAAIEAARAGEHGLGFAVVADEVRKLAEKSAQSTKEISELIQSIQKEATRAVEYMDKSTTIVNEGLTYGTDLGIALKKISNVVTEVYKFAQEIGAATTEQSHGSAQIARATSRLNEITHEINCAVEEQATGTKAVVGAMERMRDLIQQSTSGSTELAASAEQMQNMSRMLLESMDRFKLQRGVTAEAQRQLQAPWTHRLAAGRG